MKTFNIRGTISVPVVVTLEAKDKQTAIERIKNGEYGWLDPDLSSWSDLKVEEGD